MEQNEPNNKRKRISSKESGTIKSSVLATVNGMPLEIENEMEKMYHSFLWNGKAKGLMKWEQVIVNRSEGGLGIPDIKSRVEAIEIMWIKKWLSPTDVRPRWAFIMDMILYENIAKHPMIDQESKLNWLMQSWHESEAKGTKLSGNIKRMLKVARKYNITPIALKYDKEAKMNQPLWHNIMMKEANYQWNKKSARCLRQNHGIKTIGDLMEWNKVKSCSGACNKMTERLITMIPEKINPIMETPVKIRRMRLDLTPRRKERNEKNKDSQIFNPDITTREKWEEAIRLFNKNKGPKTRRIKENKNDRIIAYRNEPVNQNTKAIITIVKMNKNKINESILVAIEMKNKEEKEKKVFSFRMKEDELDSDKARASALLWVLKEAKNKRLKIKTDDKKMVNWLGSKLNKAEDEGWLNIRNERMWKMVLRKLRKRGNETKIKIINQESRKKEKINRMKEKLINEEDLGYVEIKIGRENAFNKSGAKLWSMTQKMAYELIVKEKSELPGGTRTEINLMKIEESMRERGKRISREEIWKGLEKVYSPQIADFMWKMIHGRIKCGPFFRFIPNWQEKEFCTCGASETIEHILLGCKDSGQVELWELVKGKWKQETGNEMNGINIGIIMGVGGMEIEKAQKLQQRPARDLFRKLIWLTTWVIWKERNDRIFNEKEISPKRLKKKWLKEMRKEIRIDLWEKTEAKAKKKKIEMWTTNGTFAEIKEDERGRKRIIVKI